MLARPYLKNKNKRSGNTIQSSVPQKIGKGKERGGNTKNSAEKQCLGLI
jgi:hypothetical protein